MHEALILASGSATRAKVLRDAGLTIFTARPLIDEDAIKAGLRTEGLSPRDQADALSEVKALSVSRKKSGFVIGADQMLALGSDVFDKPKDRDEARASLQALRGKTHTLLTAAVIAKDGAVIARFMDTPQITMREFSDPFLETYLDEIGDAALTSVGAYQIEGRGVQLFSRVDGDYFSILGLPLLQILAFLRDHGLAGR